MNECTHRNLLLLTPPKDRIRCRHCHLTIKRDELERRWCPECYEADGIKRTDFEEVSEAESKGVAYRCEDCGLFIAVEEEPEKPPRPDS